jgi:hypothetical protein
MAEYLRVILRFSHVFFISTCCRSDGINPIQEDSEGQRFPAARADVQKAAGTEAEVSGSEEGYETA